MGMALMKEAESMARDYQRMGIRELRERARSTHPEHDPEAARVFVDRMLDIEAGRRTWYCHENPGFQPFSSIATIGEQPGGGTAAADPLSIAYERGIPIREAQEYAEAWVASARLRPRALLAVLIRAAKLYPMSAQQQALWAKSYDFIAQHLPIYSRMLQMGSLSTMGAIASVVVEEDKTGKPRRTPNPEPSEPIFKNGMAVKNAAREARVQLLLLAQI